MVVHVILSFDRVEILTVGVLERDAASHSGGHSGCRKGEVSVFLLAGVRKGIRSVELHTETLLLQENQCGNRLTQV